MWKYPYRKYISGHSPRPWYLGLKTINPNKGSLSFFKVSTADSDGEGFKAINRNSTLLAWMNYNNNERPHDDIGE